MMLHYKQPDAYLFRMRQFDNSWYLVLRDTFLSVATDEQKAQLACGEVVNLGLYGDYVLWPQQTGPKS